MQPAWNEVRAARPKVRVVRRCCAMRAIDAPIGPATLARAVVGRNLRHTTLGAELGPRPTALVFLRHYG